jgi:Na+/alanine symporter
LISVSGVVSFGVILRVIDPLILSMVFPNVIVLLLLSGVVRREFIK